MRNIKFNYIISELFKLLIIFILCFIWLARLVNNRVLLLIISVTLTFSIYFIINFFSKKKNDKIKLKTEELEKIADIMNTFIFSSDSANIEFFYNLAKTKHQVEKKSKHLIIKHDTGNVILYPFFTYRPFDVDDFIYVYNKVKNEKHKRIVVCTNNVNQNAIKFSKKMLEEIFILNDIDTYNKLIKSYDFYPEIKQQFKDIAKTNYKDILQSTINRKKTMSYFWASICILFSSFFTRYNIYYIVLSSFLLILSLISFTKPANKNTANIEIL